MSQTSELLYSSGGPIAIEEIRSDHRLVKASFTPNGKPYPPILEHYVRFTIPTVIRWPDPSTKGHRITPTKIDRLDRRI